MPFDILARTSALTPTNLTIREQARLADNPLDLRWRAIFPTVQTDSVNLSTLSAVDFRPEGGRREWNAQGREIPEQLGARFNAQMVPINPTHHIDELRLQRLGEAGIAELIDRGIVKDVDQWATALANAVEIQTERDAFAAWFTNSVTVMDPKTGTTYAVTPFVDASRYVAAASTLAAAANAYDMFLVHLDAAYSKIGSVGPVRANRALFAEIAKDAPNLAGVRLSLSDLQARVGSEGFGDVTLVSDNRTYHAFADGGSTTTTASYVPTGRMAFAPANGVVGATYVAPVVRAQTYGVGREEARGDVSIFYSPKNDGKTLMIEAQAHRLSLPDEQNVYVVTGLA